MADKPYVEWSDKRKAKHQLAVNTWHARRRVGDPEWAEGRRDITRRHYAENKQVYIDRASKQRKLQKSNPATWRTWALTASKARARSKGLPHTITEADIAVTLRCEIFGTPLKYGSDAWDQDGPSLDCIDPGKGYVPGNVAVVSIRANRMKTNMSVEQARAILRYLEGKLP